MSIYDSRKRPLGMQLLPPLTHAAGWSRSLTSRASRVTTNDLVSAALRMRPDRIILGELRGPEAFAFLRAVRSGHPGSMTTIHADSPEAAVEQLVMLVLHTGTKLSREDVRHYVEQSIDLYVHLSRVGGKRLIEAVALSPARASRYS